MNRPAQTSGDRPSLWHNQDYLKLVLGQTVNQLGTAMSIFAFPLLVLAMKGSAVQAGAVGALSLAGNSLVSLHAGALVDRWDRKTVIVGCRAAGFLTIGSAAAALLAGHLTVAHLLVVGFVGGVTTAFAAPANSAALRAIVDRQDMGTAQAVSQGRAHAIALLGTPLGGLLFVFGRAVPLTADAASYLIALVVTTAIKSPLKPPGGSAARQSLSASIRDGLTFVWERPAIRAIAVSGSAANFAISGLLFTLVLELQHDRVSPFLIGFVEGSAAIGGVLGALAAPALLRRYRVGALSVAACQILTVATLAAAFVTSPLVLFALLVPAVFLFPAWNGGLSGYVAIVTPNELQGRVASGTSLIAQLTTPFAPLCAGALVESSGSTAAMLAFTTVMAAVALIQAVGSIRGLPLLSDVAAVPEPAGV